MPVTGAIAATEAPAAGPSHEEARRQREAAVKRWADRVDHAYQGQKERHARFALWRKYIAGEQLEADGRGANIIYANHATVLPYIYARNPEINVAPSESADPERYRLVKQFSRTLTIVLNRVMVKDAFLKRRAKNAIRSVQATGEGWLKMVYQRDWGEDPFIRSRINDVQDNLKRIDLLLRKVADPEQRGNCEAERDELQNQIRALEQRVEVVAAEGLVIDNVLSEDMLILDPSVRAFDQYVNARAIAQGIWWTKDEYEELFGWPDPNKTEGIQAPKLRDMPIVNPEGQAATPANAGKVIQWVRGWEIWDHASSTVYTVADGMNTYCREPFQPQRLGERWYPFFRWGWNAIDGRADPVSDTELQRSLQDEYNESRTQYAEHRKDSMPVRLVRTTGALTPTDVDKITHRRSRDIIPVEGLPSKPIGDDIGEFKPVTLNPAVYETQTIRTDMELMAGRGDAAAGTVANAKTATEAEILREGLQTRSNERRDGTEDELTDMAQYAAEILLQEMTPAQVKRIAGPTAIWPTMGREEIFDLVEINIRAGSTGSPNKAREREQWEKILPLLKDTILQISEARMTGRLDVATALQKLLEESLRRFDERIDLEEFLPAGEGTDEGRAQATLTQAMQRMQQLEQALAQAQEQAAAAVEQARAEGAKEAGLQAKQVEAQARQTDRAAQVREREVQTADRAAQRQTEAQVRAEEARAKAQAEADVRAEQLRLADERERELAQQRIDFEREQRDLDRQHALALERARAAARAGGGTPGATEDGLREAGLAEGQTTYDRLAGLLSDLQGMVGQVLTQIDPGNRRIIYGADGRAEAMEIAGTRHPLARDGDGNITGVAPK